MLTITRAFAGLVIIGAAVVACQKSVNPNSSPANSQSISTQTELMNATNDVYMSGAIQDENVNDVLSTSPEDSSSCRVVTYSPSKNVYPNQKTVDFGTGCLGADGVTRSGKKIVTEYMNPDSAYVGAKVSETTYSNYYEDSINVQGTVTLYKKPATSSNQQVWEYVENITLRAADGTIKSSYGVHDWTQIAGAGTSTRQDDVYQITGTSTGAEILDGATLLTFTTSINNGNPVMKPGDCYYRTSGQEYANIHIVSGGGGNFQEMLDYGNGSCDDIATLSINGGNPKQVTLPLTFWPLSL